MTTTADRIHNAKTNTSWVFEDHPTKADATAAMNEARDAGLIVGGGERPVRYSRTSKVWTFQYRAPQDYYGETPLPDDDALHVLPEGGLGLPYSPAGVSDDGKHGTVTCPVCAALFVGPNERKQYAAHFTAKAEAGA